jgi:hypothetical protein
MPAIMVRSPLTLKVVQANYNTNKKKKQRYFLQKKSVCGMI